MVDEIITLTLLKSSNQVHEYTIEWASSYDNDLKANALLMVILQQDANILSPIVAVEVSGDS